MPEYCRNCHNKGHRANQCELPRPQGPTKNKTGYAAVNTGGGGGW